MEMFSALLAICAGNSPVTGEFPAQRPVTRIFDVFFDLRPNYRLNKQREAGDLRRHCSHYDVTVMYTTGDSCNTLWDITRDNKNTSRLLYFYKFRVITHCLLIRFDRLMLVSIRR